MDTSILFAKFVGPTMLVTGVITLANRDHVRAVAKEFLDSPALIYLAGFLALLLGLAIVIFHNVWVAGWPVIITIFGWIAIVAGIVRMGAPALVKTIGTTLMKQDVLLIVSGVVSVLLGAYLTYLGFLA